MSEVLPTDLGEQFNIVRRILNPSAVRAGEITSNLKKIDNVMADWLEEGFNVWVEKHRTGHRVTYRKHNDEDATFILSQMLIDNRPVSTQISGGYNVEGMDVSITVSREGTSLNSTIRIFINGKIVAESLDSLSQLGGQIEGMAATMSGGGDRFVQAKKRDPRALANKMLTDIMTSVVDQERSQKMYDQFTGKGTEVEWIKNT